MLFDLFISVRTGGEKRDWRCTGESQPTKEPAVGGKKWNSSGGVKGGGSKNFIEYPTVGRGWKRKEGQIVCILPVGSLNGK